MARVKSRDYIFIDSHKEAGIVFLPPFLEEVVNTTLLHVLMCRVTSLVKNDTGVFLCPPQTLSTRNDAISLAMPCSVGQKSYLGIASS